MKRPIGSAWRIQAGGIGKQPLVRIYSADYRSSPKGRRLKKRTVFDELVVMAGDKCLIHVEQMDERTYFVSLGDEKRMVYVDGRGNVVVGEMYR